MPHVFFFASFQNPKFWFSRILSLCGPWKYETVDPSFKASFLSFDSVASKLGFPTFLTRTRVLSWRTWF
jgi:hypothetical protein